LRAEKLALGVWDIIAQYHHDSASITDEDKASLRARAFRFSREVESGDDWRVMHGRQIAATAISWANDDSPETFRALERASRVYEELRLR
jgi:hypothetical protein